MLENLSLGIEWPWLLLLLPFPFFAYWILPKSSEEKQAALRVPFFNSLSQLVAGSRHQQHFSFLYWIWTGLIWSLVVLAAANPLWMGAPLAIEQSGRDILIALDLSPSMTNSDMLVGREEATRLSLVKEAAREFIDGRRGDRLGLIVFGEQAYLMTPLTTDHRTLQSMLEDASAGLAGERTAIGDAIGLGIKRLLPYPQNSRVLILLTDGGNNSGALDPINAAKNAAKLGIKIYTVGLGANEMIVQDIFGTHTVNPANDLDEESLQKIAQITGGRYFRATDHGSLINALQEMDKLEPALNDPVTFRPKTVLYPYLLVASLIILIIGLLVQPQLLNSLLRRKNKLFSSQQEALEITANSGGIQS